VTVVVGTAGHIDHGKTTLLRALTGIDADRLPEERRRGMTIDVGYAHVTLPDGESLDFVDVPGHDRLVGNMLVGAGEIDAALLVVAADDGPRAQTLEHLELLDALGIDVGLAVVTKVDVLAADDDRRILVADAVADLLARTSLAGSPVILASATTGEGLDDVRRALVEVRDRVRERASAGGAHGRGAGPDSPGAARPGGAGPGGPTRGGVDHGAPGVRLAVDRSFSIRGRGTVVTGTLRGGPLERDAALRILPSGVAVRAREIQVHGEQVARVDGEGRAGGGGRVALNLSGIAAAEVRRGDVVVGRAAAGRIVATDRALVLLRRPALLATPTIPGHRPPPAAHRPSAASPGAASPSAASRGAAHGSLAASLRDGTRVRIHVATARAEAVVRRARHDVAGDDGSLTTTLRFAEALAIAPGDRFVLRSPSSGETLAGGVVVDPFVLAGASRRAATAGAVAGLRDAVLAGDPAAEDAARVALHGAIRAAVLVGGGPGAAVRTGRGAGQAVAGLDPAASDAVGDRPTFRTAGPLALAPDLADAVDADVIAAVAAVHGRNPDAPGLPLADARTVAIRGLRRRASARPADAAPAAAAIVDALVTSGRLARDGDALRDPARPAGPPPALAAAMDRLVAALTSAAPPPFDDAVHSAGCPPEGVRLLEQSGRIVRLEPDLAFAADTYRDLSDRALALARSGPLTPAAFRDATGSSRKYALVILEDLDRRQVLRRGPDGHLPGPRAPLPEPVT